ncbi:MAG: hypothetical protein SV186_02750 [Candidatus Nanohaloarchaea archaeon]|nr:hypothetical protein [Candidatus Nanohaloarchaea archaeon]
MHKTLRKLGVVTAALLTLSYTAAAVVGGPDPGNGSMAIMGHGSTSQQNTSDLLDRHIADMKIDVSFGTISTASSTARAPADTSGNAATCRKEIDTAQQTAAGKACTMQTMKLRCPHDSGFVYQAPNGCVISALQEQGWTAAGVAGPDPVNATQSYQAKLHATIQFRDTGYRVNVSKSVDNGTAHFTVRITPPARPAADVIDVTTLQRTVSADDTIEEAVVTVMIDGKQAYRNSFPRDRVTPHPGLPPVKPPEQGLRQRVEQLEQQVRLLQKKVHALTSLLTQLHPNMTDTIRSQVPRPRDLYQENETQDTAPDNRTSRPTAGQQSNTGRQERGPPSDSPARGIIDAITSFLP